MANKIINENFVMVNNVLIEEKNKADFCHISGCSQTTPLMYHITLNFLNFEMNYDWFICQKHSKGIIKMIGNQHRLEMKK